MIANHVLRDHMLCGAIVVLILSRFWNPYDCLIFWCSSVLIDFDHYLNLLYWSRFRSFAISKTFYFYSYIHDNKKKYRFLTLEIFHTVEFVLGIYFLAFSLKLEILKPVFWGMVFHIFIDFLHLCRLKSLTIRSHSIIDFMIRKRAMEKRGISPTLLHRDAGKAVVT